MADEEKKTNVATEGKFVETLKRTNTKIRQDRAESIGEDAEVYYQQTVNNIRLALKRKKRDRENMLDLSPDTAMSLKAAVEFDAPAWAAKDHEMGVEIRQFGIELELAENRFSELFGKNAV